MQLKWKLLQKWNQSHIHLVGFAGKVDNFSHGGVSAVLKEEFLKDMASLEVELESAKRNFEATNMHKLSIGQH